MQILSCRFKRPNLRVWKDTKIIKKVYHGNGCCYKKSLHEFQRANFVKSHETPKNGNVFYIYQQRDSVGIYYATVHDRKDPFSYKIYNVAKKTVESAVDAAVKYCNEEEDDA